MFTACIHIQGICCLTFPTDGDCLLFSKDCILLNHSKETIQSSANSEKQSQIKFRYYKHRPVDSVRRISVEFVLNIFDMR